MMMNSENDQKEIVLPDETIVLALQTEEKGVQVCVPPDQALSPFGWGIVLNDIARNAARVVAGESIGGQAEFLTELKRGFDAEWENPTDWPKV